MRSTKKMSTGGVRVLIFNFSTFLCHNFFCTTCKNESSVLEVVGTNFEVGKVSDDIYASRSSSSTNYFEQMTNAKFTKESIPTQTRESIIWRKLENDAQTLNMNKTKILTFKFRRKIKNVVTAKITSKNIWKHIFTIQSHQNYHFSLFSTDICTIVVLLQLQRSYQQQRSTTTTTCNIYYKNWKMHQYSKVAIAAAVPVFGLNLGMDKGYVFSFS